MNTDEIKAKDWKVVRQDTHGGLYSCKGIRCGDEALKTEFLTAAEAEAAAERLLRHFNPDGGHKQHFMPVSMDTPCLM